MMRLVILSTAQFVAALPRQLPRMQQWVKVSPVLALFRDLHKPFENPAIGLLLCASKDDEAVEYALSRSLSPAKIAEYQTQLPYRKLLQAKLYKLYLLNIALGEM